jgi:hypothetical protein
MRSKSVLIKFEFIVLIKFEFIYVYALERAMRACRQDAGVPFPARLHSI